MKKTESKFAFLLLFCLLLYGSILFYPLELGPSSSKTPQAFRGIAMTIPYQIFVDPLADSEIVLKIIKETFSETDRIFNKWNPHSEISILNQLPENSEIAISPELNELLQLAKTVVEISENRFDPTIEPLQNLWIRKLKKGEEPTDEEIAQIIPAIGWDKIRFNNGKFSKTHANVSLDLCGIAKGHCIDLLVERLKKIGCKHIYVEWGGEIRTFGVHPEERPWKIYISRLEDANPEKAVAFIELHNEAIATSGDYLQFWKTQTLKIEKIYFHIFDPFTGRPLEQTEKSIAGISVIAPTCALADGLATSGMLFANEEEANLWTDKVKAQFPGITFWILKR